MLKYWLGLLLELRRIDGLFSKASVVIDSLYQSKCLIVSRKASLIAQELLTWCRNVNESKKKNGIDFVVSVSKICSLSKQNNSDFTILYSNFMSFQFCKESTPNNPIRIWTIIVQGNPLAWGKHQFFWWVK